MDESRFVGTVAAVREWSEEGGPIPNKNDVFEVISALVQSATAYANHHYPPLQDEDLAPGVVRFKTMAQIKKEGIL